MFTRRMARLGAGSGIAYVGLIVAAGELGPAGAMPAVSASPQEIGDYISSHAPTTGQWVAVYLEVVALLALVVFVGYLWRVLRDAEARGGWLAGVALAGGLLSAALKLGSLPAAFAALYRADDGISAQTATALIDMNNAAFALTWATTALMLAATASVVLAGAALPRWLGWSALGTAVALMASLPFFATGDPPTFMLALIWIIAASVVLLRRVDTSELVAACSQRAPSEIAADAA